MNEDTRASNAESDDIVEQAKKRLGKPTMMVLERWYEDNGILLGIAMAIADKAGGMRINEAEASEFCALMDAGKVKEANAMFKNFIDREFQEENEKKQCQNSFYELGQPR